ncbi:hypothetical protein [Ralstonia syzygii]|uniref:Uncharacterized protein n=1 Tax=Ralstonia syzygii R24 TaxID=907261 RepID=G2ZYV5_9RALS|nr:hypothetical protein [Ralstonia syzygii]CCA85146.1 hypothetical protein RALSY_11147 [Ralstonia syzygii R24]
MLSESVLEELLRDAPMREHLVREAWPDLSTETRLQIIQAFGVSWMAGVPDWLAVLALNDTAVIVRYWAARLTYFQPPRPQGFDDVFGPRPERTEEQKQLYEKVRADSSELVRLCADCGETLSYETLTTASQFQRLAFLRALSMPHLGEFFQWLDTAVRAGVPDLELRECLREVVSLPAVRVDLERDPDAYFDDALMAVDARASIKTGWDVARIAGPALQRQLAYLLPTRLGLTAITADELATMPEEVLAALPGRIDDSEEVAGLVALVREHPERFPERVVKSVNRADDNPVLSADKRALLTARQALDRSRATLEAVIQLREKVTVLGDQVQQMTRKRGFFG